MLFEILYGLLCIENILNIHKTNCVLSYFTVNLFMWLIFSSIVGSVTEMCPQICTAQYDPVCGRNVNNRYRQFTNLCNLNIHNCENPNNGKILLQIFFFSFLILYIEFYFNFMYLLLFFCFVFCVEEALTFY